MNNTAKVAKHVRCCDCNKTIRLMIGSNDWGKTITFACDKRNGGCGTVLRTTLPKAPAPVESEEAKRLREAKEYIDKACDGILDPLETVLGGKPK